MTAGKRFIIYFAITAFLCATIHFVANEAILNFVQQKIYSPAATKKLEERTDSFANTVSQYINQQDSLFTLFSGNSVIRNSCKATLTEEEIAERSHFSASLLAETPGLKGIRIINENAKQIFYSTFSEDFVTHESGTIKYTNYPKNALPYSLIAVKSGEKGKLTPDLEQKRLIFSYPFYDEDLEYRGTIAFYVDASNALRYLVPSDRLSNKTEIVLCNAGNSNFPFGLVFSVPKNAKENFINAIIETWEKATDKIEKNEKIENLNISDKENSWIVFSKKCEDLGFVSMVYPAEALEMPAKSQQYIIWATMFFICFVTFICWAAKTETERKKTKLLEEDKKNKKNVKKLEPNPMAEALKEQERLKNSKDFAWNNGENAKTENIAPNEENEETHGLLSKAEKKNKESEKPVKFKQALTPNFNLAKPEDSENILNGNAENTKNTNAQNFNAQNKSEETENKKFTQNELDIEENFKENAKNKKIEKKLKKQQEKEQKKQEKIEQKKAKKQNKNIENFDENADFEKTESFAESGAFEKAKDFNETKAAGEPKDFEEPKVASEIKDFEEPKVAGETKDFEISAEQNKVFNLENENIFEYSDNYSEEENFTEIADYILDEEDFEVYVNLKESEILNETEQFKTPQNFETTAVQTKIAQNSQNEPRIQFEKIEKNAQNEKNVSSSLSTSGANNANATNEKNNASEPLNFSNNFVNKKSELEIFSTSSKPTSFSTSKAEKPLNNSISENLPKSVSENKPIQVAKSNLGSLFKERMEQNSKSQSISALQNSVAAEPLKNALFTLELSQKNDKKNYKISNNSLSFEEKNDEDLIQAKPQNMVEKQKGELKVQVTEAVMEEIDIQDEEIEELEPLAEGETYRSIFTVGSGMPLFQFGTSQKEKTGRTNYAEAFEQASKTLKMSAYNEKVPNTIKESNGIFMINGVDKNMPVKINYDFKRLVDSVLNV